MLVIAAGSPRWSVDFRMLTQLTRVMRVKAARVIAALYTLCLVAPIVAFSLADSALAAHCLDLPQGVIQVQHAHQHGEAQANQGHAHHGHDDAAMAVDAAMNDQAGMNDHSGAGHSKSKSAVPACCGVMCVTALPANLFELMPRTMDHASVAVVSDAGIPGEAPDRRYRPPILLLSL